ncbi:putative flippase GtrA [Paracidovorax citrulli]|uniref:GtrA family protein n=1 Tax=Paracidovorax citrulli (strain AAC00-1) TaxID=397945 RepID=A1TJR4_PARC0|nr:GtrA family protein [Paracidovorax citrulli AAC00-1]ATG95661.1 GtrA family protein [Paracidovorax citrulli]PVY65390.1 putative flippase GtrA [Paracidovorax citrulli]QCX11182.1 hypothetical protein APS58_2359 [Paracidovorax citrulli]REG70428.1 putative flippase GtrA [Paracidovorax citrulli]
MLLRRLPQGVQFVLVGGAAAATHLGTMGLLVALAGMPPLAANVLAFLVAFAVSYNGHALLTFAASRRRGPTAMARYFAVACLTFAANELMYFTALHILHWHYFWSQAGVLVLVALGTFVLSKFWAFKAPSGSGA